MGKPVLLPKTGRAKLPLAAVLTVAVALGQQAPATGLVNFYGEITAVVSNEVRVLTNPRADPQSSYKQEYKMVTFDPTTTFEGSKPEDLRATRGVQIIGIEQKDGTIRATKIVVYEGNAPVQQRKRIPTRLPNGQTR